MSRVKVDVRAGAFKTAVGSRVIDGLATRTFAYSDEDVRQLCCAIAANAQTTRRDLERACTPSTPVATPDDEFDLMERVRDFLRTNATAHHHKSVPPPAAERRTTRRQSKASRRSSTPTVVSETTCVGSTFSRAISPRPSRQ